MNADKARFQGKHHDVTHAILDAYFDICNVLGSGFLESVYHAALVSALTQAGLKAASQSPIPIYYRGRIIADFRADLIVEDKVLVELKAIQALDQSHMKQVLNYLKATPIEVALLLNFGTKPEFKRIVMDNEFKEIRVAPRESVVVLGESL
jgi:GxxExxY protein